MSEIDRGFFDVGHAAVWMKILVVLEGCIYVNMITTNLRLRVSNIYQFLNTRDKRPKYIYSRAVSELV